MMQTLQMTFQELYDKVAQFLGSYGSSGASGNELTQAKDLVHSGYRRFLQSMDWSFLKKTTMMSTMGGQYRYSLPEDYGHLIGTFQFDSDKAYPPLEERHVDTIRDMRAVSTHTSYPEFFGTTMGEFSPKTRQGWEVLFYPTPDQSYVLHFMYRVMARKMVDDEDYPMGGPEATEAILQCCLAAAEFREDEVRGPQDLEAGKRIRELWNIDRKRQPRHLGYNPDFQGYSTWETARGSYRIANVVYNT